MVGKMPRKRSSFSWNNLSFQGLEIMKKSSNFPPSYLESIGDAPSHNHYPTCLLIRILWSPNPTSFTPTIPVVGWPFSALWYPLLRRWVLWGCLLVEVETLSACWLSHPLVCLQRVPEGAFRITVEKSGKYIYIYILYNKVSIYNSLRVSKSVCLREIRLMLQKSWEFHTSLKRNLSWKTSFVFSSSLKRVRLFTRCPRKFQEQIFESLCLWVISTLGYN